MQKYDWVFAHSSVRGNSHLLENIPCQDANEVFQHPKFNICVVCDGAGSCSYSDLGAKIVSTSCLFHFKELINKNRWYQRRKFPTYSKWHKQAKNTLSIVKEDLINYSIQENIDLKNLSCTVIVLITLDSGILVTHIGDGRAGYCNINDDWFSIIRPYKGELANQTVFITSDIWKDDIIDNYIESNIIDDNIKAICLLSDGCEKAAFECNLFNEEEGLYYDPNKPYPLFFNTNVKLLPSLKKMGKEEEINKLWEEFLTSGNDTLKFEPDDKTIILGVKYECNE